MVLKQDQYHSNELKDLDDKKIFEMLIMKEGVKEVVD